MENGSPINENTDCLLIAIAQLEKIIRSTIGKNAELVRKGVMGTLNGDAEADFLQAHFANGDSGFLYRMPGQGSDLNPDEISVTVESKIHPVRIEYLINDQGKLKVIVEIAYSGEYHKCSIDDPEQVLGLCDLVANATFSSGDEPVS